MRVLIVGAGLAGLAAASRLQEAGHQVVVLDKGRSPGGRMATRRIGAATLDHGAQFFTVRTDALAGAVRGWSAEGLVAVWTTGWGNHPDGHERYRVIGGMNALAKRLARGVDVRCGVLAFAVEPDGESWVVVDDTSTRWSADAVVLTCPVPQSFGLCASVWGALPLDRVRAIDYERTLTALVVLDGPSALAAPGGLQEPDETFAFVSDNALKGTSSVPALTLHVRSELSAAWWDDEPSEVLDRLRALAAPHVGGAGVIAAQLKRWRFATPTTVWPEPCLVVDAGVPGPLVFAGDAFAGPRVEGAITSGWAAADALAGVA